MYWITISSDPFNSQFPQKTQHERRKKAVISVDNLYIDGKLFCEKNIYFLFSSSLFILSLTHIYPFSYLFHSCSTPIEQCTRAHPSTHKHTQTQCTYGCTQTWTKHKNYSNNRLPHTVTINSFMTSLGCNDAVSLTEQSDVNNKVTKTT